jgi:tripartite-type tricarboxylate transporter receptor subunit TctC
VLAPSHTSLRGSGCEHPINPGKLGKCWAPGGGRPIASAMLMRAANVTMAYVPLPGALAVNALLGGHVTFHFTDYATLAALRPRVGADNR